MEAEKTFVAKKGLNPRWIWFLAIGGIVFAILAVPVTCLAVVKVRQATEKREARALLIDPFKNAPWLDKNKPSKNKTAK